MAKVSETSYSRYLRRVGAIQERPRNFWGWKFEESSLYKHRPDPLNDLLVPDLGSWQLVIPKEQRVIVVEKVHLKPPTGQLGIEKTYTRITLTYYWLAMYHDAVKFIRDCGPCQRNKVEQARPISLMGQ